VTVADVATITFKPWLFARKRHSAFGKVSARRSEPDTPSQVVASSTNALSRRVNIFYTQDQTPRAQAQVTEMEGNIAAALAIVSAAVVAALGLRSGIIVAAAIPLAFLFGLIAVYLMAFVRSARCCRTRDDRRRSMVVIVIAGKSEGSPQRPIAAGSGCSPCLSMRQHSPHFAVDVLAGHPVSCRSPVTVFAVLIGSLIRHVLRPLPVHFGKDIS
jgi:hypothetical protein